MKKKITLKELIKHLYYGIYVDYHLNKAHKLLDKNCIKASDYHFEMAQYYYEVSYGHKFNDKK